jgi:hypothetical protein
MINRSRQGFTTTDHRTGIKALNQAVTNLLNLFEQILQNRQVSAENQPDNRQKTSN